MKVAEQIRTCEKCHVAEGVITVSRSTEDGEQEFLLCGHHARLNLDALTSGGWVLTVKQGAEVLLPGYDGDNTEEVEDQEPAAEKELQPAVP